MKLKYEFDILKKELIFTYYKIKSGHRLQMFKHRLIFFPGIIFQMHTMDLVLDRFGWTTCVAMAMSVT